MVLRSSSGKVLRVAIDEIKNKNSIDKGGLGLRCIATMNNSLLLSQLMRLLKSNNQQALKHVAWGNSQ